MPESVSIIFQEGILMNILTLGLTRTKKKGDEIVCVIKRARPIPQNSSGPSSSSSNLLASNKVRRGDIRRAVIVRTKKETNRADGRSIRFDDNAAVLLNNKKELLGTKINGVVAAELREKVSRSPTPSFSSSFKRHHLLQSNL
jgi:ribosomal protein L14